MLSRRNSLRLWDSSKTVGSTSTDYSLKGIPQNSKTIHVKIIQTEHLLPWNTQINNHQKKTKKTVTAPPPQKKKKWTGWGISQTDMKGHQQLLK